MITHLNDPKSIRNRRSAIGRTLVVLALLSFASLAHAQMEWTLAPYVWGANITARGDISEYDAIDRTATFGEIVDDTDFAFMGYIEGRGERAGFFLDGAYLNLGSQETNLVVNPLVTVPTEVHTDMKLSVLDGVAFYRPAGGDDGLDVYIGVRMVDIDQKFDLTFAPPGQPLRLQIDEMLFNGIAGIRYSKMLSENWSLRGRADAGAGDAEFTWNAQATAGWWFGDARTMSLEFGWKYTELKFENEDNGVNIDSKLEMSGPLVGVAFRF